MLYLAITADQIIIGVILVAVIGLMIVYPMLRNKKNAKEIVNVHSSLKAGDKIMTIGGIIGTIIEIRQTSPVDKEMVVETGNTTMVFDIKALYQVIPPAMPNANAAPVGEVFENHAVETEAVEVEPVLEETADDNSESI